MLKKKCIQEIYFKEIDRGMCMKPKICFAASSGGHFEQMMMLRPMMKEYECFLLTEKIKYKTEVEGVRTYYVEQVNRKEVFFPLKMILIYKESLKIYKKEKPNVVICTGVLAMIPMCLIVKKHGGKLIYIESFAKINSPTKTGQFLYKKADHFFVQWESMKQFFPNAVYVGGIY